MNRRSLICSVLSALMIFTSSASHAGMVSTPQLLSQDARAQHLLQVQAFIERDEVRQQMVSLGVDPALALDRVAALTDSELQQLSNEIDTLPAGSGVLGAALLVLLILILLEIVGAINIFPKI